MDSFLFMTLSLSTYIIPFLKLQHYDRHMKHGLLFPYGIEAIEFNLLNIFEGDSN